MNKKSRSKTADVPFSTLVPAIPGDVFPLVDPKGEEGVNPVVKNPEEEKVAESVSPTSEK